MMWLCLMNWIRLLGLGVAGSTLSTRSGSWRSTTPCRPRAPSVVLCCVGRGLYTSHLSEWRNSVERAAAAALEPKTRRSKTSPAERDLARAQDRIARLEAELARTKLALEITGKAHALLEMLSESAATEPKSKP